MTQKQQDRGASDKGASDKSDRAVVNGAGQAVSALRASVPSADLVTMTRAQMAVLLRMDDGLGYPFRDIAHDCRLSIAETRSIIHQFHRQGLTGFGPLYSDDGPAICGSGYWLRKPGWELQSQVSKFLTWEEREELTDPEWAVLRPIYAQAIEARKAETSGSACESAVGEADAPERNHT